MTEKDIMAYEKGPSVEIAEMPPWSATMKNMPNGRSHFCFHGASSSSGSAPSITSVPQVSAGETQNGSCIRNQPAKLVAIRFCHITQCTAEPSRQVTPCLWTALKK